LTLRGAAAGCIFLRTGGRIEVSTSNTSPAPKMLGQGSSTSATSSRRGSRTAVVSNGNPLEKP
jgi:hypothetical protein